MWPPLKCQLARCSHSRGKSPRAGGFTSSYLGKLQSGEKELSNNNDVSTFFRLYTTMPKEDAVIQFTDNMARVLTRAMNLLDTDDYSLVEQLLLNFNSETLTMGVYQKRMYRLYRTLYEHVSLYGSVCLWQQQQAYLHHIPHPPAFDLLAGLHLRELGDATRTLLTHLLPGTWA